MLLGPCLAGLTLARIVDGEDGIWDFFSRIAILEKVKRLISLLE
jgi:hypothetical protein